MRTSATMDCSDDSVASLAGVRIVEACQRLVGPFAGWHLAMLGADVVKVEPPTGDIARAWDGGRLFDVINGQKRFVRSISIILPSARRLHRCAPTVTR